ncbi:MAG: hypothetical protein FWH01_15450 [Oscillospiraceae bacterium]|nr:hypothetical protein [Oscillospiraceae bacterium]
MKRLIAIITSISLLMAISACNNDTTNNERTYSEAEYNELLMNYDELQIEFNALKQDSSNKIQGYIDAEAEYKKLQTDFIELQSELSLLQQSILDEAPKYADAEDFILKQSLALTLEVQNKSKIYTKDIIDAYEYEEFAEYWMGFNTVNISEPSSIKIISYNSSFASKLARSMAEKDPSNKLVEMLAPRMFNMLIGYTNTTLYNMENLKYSLNIISTSAIFNESKIEKAPPEFIDSIVIIDYDSEYTVLVYFSLKDEYVLYTISNVLPISADNFFDEYANIIMDVSEIDLSKYMKIIPG